MLAMALLLVASTVMQGHYEWYDSWPYDAQCLFNNLIGNIGGTPRYLMTVSLVLICINYPLNVIPLYKRPMEVLSPWLETKPRTAQAQAQAIENLKEKMSRMTAPTYFEHSMKRFGCVLLIMFVSTIGWVYFALIALIGSNICSLALNIFWFAYSLWGIIGDRDIPPSEMNGNENAMSFGQIVPILLLSSIVLVFREAYDDQKQKMEEEGHSPSHSSQLSLIRTRNSAAAASTASRSFGMTGAVQDAEDDVELEASPPRRVDTEMGGRSQASGLEGGSLGRDLQRRPTFPPPAVGDDAQLGSGQT